MGKLKVIKAGPHSSIQDLGRFGYRRFGIPQSGAMDPALMKLSNQLVSNPNHYPTIEIALGGIAFESHSDTSLGVTGATLTKNGEIQTNGNAHVKAGDVIEVSKPEKRYAYISIGGLLDAKHDFGSYSTYVQAGFGGMAGRMLQKGDLLETDKTHTLLQQVVVPEQLLQKTKLIHILKGPEWYLLKELPETKTFTIDAASNRMGVRLSGEKLKIDAQEIASSAVIPGTIQLPPDGHPIVLMNDCQTTGGYPRIGKVVDEDLPKLAQLAPLSEVVFNLNFSE
ncbi:biotin-dependent carboxylase uncharacterized domain-containing protein [Ekhidna lutea]|uniref:Biotin-dependent carboxylase uncharacterized domain-containing protein n=1 Tax=Ekhidna lutea TaxID=447679 RepID=A0A239EY70_EKHLU|nr:biotin-dependent carboxyltransferase family protein [Ekhidna lutea]SNS49569.1 biotin-dependent carboxylase uncharacterized domain-containing protein [Ekhidna lutea]